MLSRCGCRKCIEQENKAKMDKEEIFIRFINFIVCRECGNKRCPHANNHNNACTKSNEPGQAGSAYQ